METAPIAAKTSRRCKLLAYLEGWKPYSGLRLVSVGKVVSLPMRDGNQAPLRPEPSTVVVSLPMRDGN